MKKILYIGDDANWVLDEIGKSLENALRSQNFSRAKHGLFNFGGINHYSNRYAVYSKKLLMPFGHNILTYFHGEDADIELLEQLKNVQHKFSFIHTSCELTRQHLLKHGIENHKIIVIPIGIDISHFSPVDDLKRKLAREKFKIPQDATVIGSFQKDSNGWEDSTEPKLIKGPDVFCDAIEKIHQEMSVHVLLTGPSRGYVKQRLTQAKIPFTHIFLENYREISECYHALNLYIVASRLEGGPRAPMECFASGIPVVSTHVGQVPELMRHGENGFITKVEDSDTLAKYSSQILKSKELQRVFIKNGIKDVENYDYKNISDLYWEKMYLPILNSI